MEICNFCWASEQVCRLHHLLREVLHTQGSVQLLRDGVLATADVSFDSDAMIFLVLKSI